MSDVCPIDLPGIETIRRIGSGGFGEVWLARQTDFDRQVALKVGHRPFASIDEGRRFERECKALGRLSGHPHIVHVHTSGLENRLPYLVMEFVEGGTLADIGTTLHEGELRRVAGELCNAVQAAHDVGVLHRDLKPENVFLRGNRSVVLGDFGIARLGDGNNTSAPRITASIPFAAPETLNGRPPTELTDVYGIGITLASAVIGRSPYDSDERTTLEALIARVLLTEPPNLVTYGLSPGLSALIGRAIATEPAQRPSSAAEFASLLRQLPVQGHAGTTITVNDAFVSSAPRSVPPSPPPANTSPGSWDASAIEQARLVDSKTTSGNKLQKVLLACGVAVLIAAAGIWALNRNGDSPQNETIASASSGSAVIAPDETTTSVEEQPLQPLQIPLSSTEISDLADIPIDTKGLDPLLGPANSPQYCDVRPDITGLVETTAAVYPTDSSLSTQQVAIRMHRFGTAEQAADFMTSYSTILCDSWESTEYSSEGITTLTAMVTESTTRYGDETIQIDEQAMLPVGVPLFARTVLVRSGPDVLKLVFITINERELEPKTDRLVARSIESLGY